MRRERTRLHGFLSAGFSQRVFELGQQKSRSVLNTKSVPYHRHALKSAWRIIKSGEANAPSKPEVHASVKGMGSCLPGIRDLERRIRRSGIAGDRENQRRYLV